MGNGSGTSFVNYLGTTYPVTVNTDKFIQSATVDPELGELVVTLGDYWTAPTAEQPEAPPLMFARFSFTPQEAGPQDPIVVPVTPGTPVPPVAPAPDVIETTAPAPQLPDTLPATGADDLEPMVALVGASLLVLGALILAVRNRTRKS